MKLVPVLIAGGGPVGMTLACELSRRGIECMLVERNATTTRYPKMDITNARSMELFRRLALVNALRSVAVREDNNFDVSWVTSLTGHELHRFRYPSVNEWRRLSRKNNDGSMPGGANARLAGGDRACAAGRGESAPRGRGAVGRGIRGADAGCGGRDGDALRGRWGGGADTLPLSRRLR